MRSSFKIVGGGVLLFLTLTTSVFILLAFEPLKELEFHSPLTEDNVADSSLTENNTTDSSLIENEIIPFDFIRQGSNCGIFTKNNLTITESEAWEKLWADIYNGHTPLPELPPVNFTTDLVFVVFQGERPTAGYMTNITRIILTETSYEVYIDELHPGAHCITAQVLTQPYHIVKISNFPQDLPVKFVYNIIVHDCGY